MATLRRWIVADTLEAIVTPGGRYLVSAATLYELLSPTDGEDEAGHDESEEAAEALLGAVERLREQIAARERRLGS